MYVCAQLFISYVCMCSVIYIYVMNMYVIYNNVCDQLFISYVCMCSVIYKLCMYVCAIIMTHKERYTCKIHLYI